MEIILSNKLVVNKQEALYFHGSPGLGKTYLVRRIFSKTDFPCGYGRAVEAIKFLALDFNRSACNDACRFKEDLKNNPNLFALARLFYVNFAVQKKLKWDVFLEEAVVPLIRYGLAIKFVELMELQFKI